MHTRRKVLGMLTGGAAVTATCVAWMASSIFSDEEHTIRFKISLEIEADGKTFHGFSVIAATKARTISQTGRIMFVEGEAVVVDLEGRGRVFGLLALRTEHGRPSHDSLAMLPLRVFRSRGLLPSYRDFKSNPEDFDFFEWDSIKGITREVELSPSEIPFLIHFKDLGDPSTVESIDPNAMEHALGPGVRLKKASLRVTDESQEERLQDVLPWFPLARDKSLGAAANHPVPRPTTAAPPLKFVLSNHHFKMVRR